MSATESYTAAGVRNNVLFEAMDARAHNVDQAGLIWNPSPEADSLLEYMAEVQHLIPTPVLGEMLTIVKELLASNLAEGSHEMRIAGFADQMANFMRARETGARP